MLWNYKRAKNTNTISILCKYLLSYIITKQQELCMWNSTLVDRIISEIVMLFIKKTVVHYSEKFSLYYMGMFLNKLFVTN